MRPNVHYTDPAVTIWHGDSIETMRELPDNSIDSIVTDPPYGLGFMGKAWDALPPGEEWAAECLRVLKPGGHLLAFGGSRTWHRLAVAVEDAGFEIRDSIAWLYGSGFPKHRAALKPAFEPVVMGRKPFKGSLDRNESEYGTGALNIDAARIGETVETWPKSRNYSSKEMSRPGSTLAADAETQATGPAPAGRWPANVVLDETTAPLLDQQSGTTKSPAPYVQQTKVNGDVYGLGSLNNKAGKISTHHGDSGGASRFFKVVESDVRWAVSPHFPREFDDTFMYVAKAPKRERPVVDGVAHPTVKPLALMRWLVRLVTPPGGVVLDPFEGSGTTLEACLLEGFRHVGIEREADYLPLIMSRLERQAGTLPQAA